MDVTAFRRLALKQSLDLEAGGLAHSMIKAGNAQNTD